MKEVRYIIYSDNSFEMEFINYQNMIQASFFSHSKKLHYHDLILGFEMKYINNYLDELLMK